MLFAEEERNALTRARAKPGSQVTGQNVGQVILTGSWDERTKPAATPQGTLLLRAGRSVVGMALVLPAGGRVVPRPLCTSMDLAWA